MIKVLIVFMTLICSTAWAGPLKLVSSDVSFVAVGKPGFLRINGKGGTMQADLSKTGDKLSGEIKVDLSKFVTGMALRDEHMKKEYLEIGKYPEAVLKITQATLNEGQKIPFKGILRLHGQEHEVEGMTSIKPDKNSYKFEANFELLLSDYKIDIPTYAGVKVADKVNVLAQFEAGEMP